jgi:CheY-like chemotaxis protein
MNPANLEEAETVTAVNREVVTQKQDMPKLGEIIQAPIKHQKQEQLSVNNAEQDDNNEDNSPRAIVVDDSASVRKQLELELALFNVKVDYAATAAETNQLLDKNNYHVAFLDVMLPDSDGFQICKQIKSNTKSTNVVMLTGKASPADKVRGSLAGCDDYLIKPVGRQTFQNAAKKYLNMIEHEAMEA